MPRPFALVVNSMSHVSKLPLAMAPKSAAKSQTSDKKNGRLNSRQKLPQKKEKTTEEKLQKLFASLCAQIDGGHFRNGLKTCDKSITFI